MARPEPFELAAISSRDSGRCLGGLAVLRTWMAIASTRNLNMFTLIALGTGVAWAYSVVATFAPGLLPAGISRRRWFGRHLFRGGGGDHRAGLAGAGFGIERPRKNLRCDPRASRPCPEEGAPYRCGWHRTEVSARRVAVGDRVRVRPGERSRWTANSSRAVLLSMNRW